MQQLDFLFVYLIHKSESKKPTVFLYHMFLFRLIKNDLQSNGNIKYTNFLTRDKFSIQCLFAQIYYYGLKPKWKLILRCTQKTAKWSTLSLICLAASDIQSLVIWNVFMHYHTASVSIKLNWELRGINGIQNLWLVKNDSRTRNRLNQCHKSLCTSHSWSILTYSLKLNPS